MTHTTTQSKALFDRALRVMVEGGSSPSRGPANYGAFPPFLARAQGAQVFDEDGNVYLDWMMAYGALPLGHAHPAVVDAVQEACRDGTLFAAATAIEVEVAELVQSAVPSAERVRFANTGTEAAMAAIRLARGYTGRPKFIKFEGHYHGWYDDYLVNAHPHQAVSLGHRRDPIKIAESSGLNRHALDDTIVVPWNDLDAVQRALDGHRGEVAAIVTEGIMANMGVIPPSPGFLPAIQQLAHEHGALFVLDETVTGFRIAAGGCQAHFDLHPDLTILGKALGCGLPVAALVGRADVMEALAWGGVLHYGTQNGSRIGLYAARAGLQSMLAQEGAHFDHTWRIADALCGGLRDLFATTRTAAIVQNVGPMLQIMFTKEPAIGDYRAFCAHVDRERYRRLAHALFAHGVYLTPSAALHSVCTAPHTADHVAETLSAVERALAQIDA